MGGGFPIIDSLPIPDFGSVPIETFDSLGGLVDLAICLREEARKKGDELYFRGEPACYKSVQAKLYREPGVLHEQEVYQAALSSTPHQFYPLQTIFDRLTHMRHYDYGVRLLDVSPNILTSWFMALDSWNIHAKDVYPCPRIVAIRVPRGREKPAESDLVTILSALAKVPNKFEIPKWWHEIRKELPDFDEDIFWEHFDDFFQNWCVSPRLENPRVAMQQGKFILFGLHPDSCRYPKEVLLRNKRAPLSKDSAGCGQTHVPLQVTRPFYPTHKGELPPISIDRYLLPSQALMPGTTLGQLEFNISSALSRLAHLGIAQHTLYPDDLSRHASYWNVFYKQS